MMQIKVERERETGPNSRCAYCAFERSVICLYLENRCVKVCKCMYIRLCSQSLQCFVLIIGATGSQITLLEPPKI